jgi:hypothetical protein
MQAEMNIVQQPSQRRQNKCSYCNETGHNASNRHCEKKVKLFTALYNCISLTNTNEHTTIWADRLTEKEVELCCKEMGMWDTDRGWVVTTDAYRQSMKSELLRTRRILLEQAEIYPQFIEVNEVSSANIVRFIVNNKLSYAFYRQNSSQQNYIRRVVLKYLRYEIEHRTLSPILPQEAVTCYATLAHLYLAFSNTPREREAIQQARAALVEEQQRLEMLDRQRHAAAYSDPPNLAPLLEQVRPGREPFNDVLPNGVAERSMVREQRRTHTDVFRSWGFDVYCKESTENTESMECSICYDTTPARFQTTLNCDHKFCVLCFQQQAKLHLSVTTPPCCGMCREPIQKITVYSNVLVSNFRDFVNHP